ncbi:MAG: UDP-N-acetyl-D-mannosamine dehydrogenase [Bacteroidetes bacterium]|nr:MAG: UDP-N-acetyl-D-mannosamine dehydrogenase [Bacteroidota bacterium]
MADSKDRLCFLGLGYIGLPTAIVAAQSGLRVLGVDIDCGVVEETNAGRLHFVEEGLEDLLGQALAGGHFRASTAVEEAEVYVVAVPTPFKGDHEPDVSYVEAAVRGLLPLLKPDDLLIIESTSPVGTTESMRGMVFAERPDLLGQLHMAYCPERVLPGNVVYELVHNDRVIGGVDDASTKRAMEFYAHFVKGELFATDARTAEMCKLTENASRDVQIAFANELSIICDKAGIDVWELIELANRHPRVNILRPGCGVGGHCIAVDPYFITSEFPTEARIIAEARRINNYKALYCAEAIDKAMLRFELDKHRPPVVALMGLAFKPNIDDLRESPAKYIVSKVMQGKDNADILVVEPNVREHRVFKLTDYREAWERADIVVFLVAHDEFRTLPEAGGKQVMDFCGIRK